MTWEQFNPFSSNVQALIIPSLGTNLLVHTQHKERTVTAIKLKITNENNYNNTDFNRNSTPQSPSILIVFTCDNSRLACCLSQQHL